jgi:hypothetical protein
MVRVASPQPKPPSRRLLDAAHAEQLSVNARLAAVRERRHSLQHELRELDVQERDLAQRLALLSKLAGDHEPRRALEAVSLQVAGSTLQSIRGAEIRRTAGRLIARSENPHRAIHYTEWFRLVLEDGFVVGGRDPLATFLTQLNRSPVVRREAKAGVYRLDYEVVPELERQLIALHQELARLHTGQQTIDQIGSAREQRDRLTAAIDRLERTLEEATTTLHAR